MTLKTKPWTHQTEALAFIRDKPGALLAMAMGTGKTLCAIALMSELDCRRTLVLCPLSIVDHVWPQQIATHSSADNQVVPLGSDVTGVKAKQARAAQAVKRNDKRPLILIVNYESAWREPLSSWLRSQQWDLLIMDESHRLKSPGGQASRWASRMADRVPRRLALTGTPMPNSPLDIYAQYRALNKRIYGVSYHQFKDRYAVIAETTIPLIRPDTGQPELVKKVVGYKNLDELNRKFYSIAYRVSAADALDLPPTIKSNYRLRLSAKAQRTYLQMEQTFTADLEDGTIATAANALSRLLRLQQMTSGYAPNTDGEIVQVDTAKAAALEDIIQDLPEDEPIVVFARFRHDLDAILNAAQRQGRPAYEISGKTKDLPQWNKHGGVLAVQIQAGGLGLDLTKARYCVYYSPGFSLGDYQQSMARLDRPGQTRPVQYIHLIASGTVDEAVIGSLDKKEDLIAKVLHTKNLSTQENPR